MAITNSGQSLATAESQEKFFDAFIDSRGDMSGALSNTGIARKTFYRWLREDEKFSERYDRMRLQLAEEIENNAITRVLAPTANRGSDTLVSKLLTGLKPERYGERAEAAAPTVIFISGLRDTPRPGVADAATPPEAGTHTERQALPAPTDE